MSLPLPSPRWRGQGDARTLLAQVNHALDELNALGQCAVFAQKIGLTYVAPRERAILERITPCMLGSD
jgi:hypothetical protein